MNTFLTITLLGLVVAIIWAKAKTIRVVCFCLIVLLLAPFVQAESQTIEPSKRIELIQAENAALKIELARMQALVAVYQKAEEGRQAVEKLTALKAKAGCDLDVEYNCKVRAAK